jgi:hypothetical protein
MKTLLKLFVVLALVAMMSGCVQMHMDTEVKKDGSGTMEMTLSLSKVLTDAIEEMGTEDMDDDIGNIGSMLDMDEKVLKEKVKGHGVTVKKHKRSVVEGRETLNVAFEFKDLEGLSFAMGEVMGEGDGGMAIIDLGDGKYALRPYEYNWPEKADAEAEVEAEDETDAEEMDPEKMQKQMELMGKLMGAMGELEINMKITVPGDIIESNAPIVEGRTSIWSVDSSNMMTAGGDMEPNIIFSSKGLKLKAIKE